jgi:hypothetical protein
MTAETQQHDVDLAEVHLAVAEVSADRALKAIKQARPWH